MKVIGNLSELISELKKIPLPGVNEKAAQRELSNRMTEWVMSDGSVFHREHRLSNAHIVDFYVGGEFKIGIELKLRANRRDTYYQVHHYCMYEEIDHMILVTNRVMGMPAQINGKSITVINSGLAWL